jgi:WD40 repeat protein
MLLLRWQRRQLRSPCHARLERTLLSSHRPSILRHSGELTARVTPATTLWGHTSRVWDIAVSGGLAMTGSEDATARVWDAASGAQLATLQGHGGRGVWRLMPVGQHLATAGADGTVKLWHLPAWLAQQRHAPLPAGGEASSAGAYIIPAARISARWQALSPGASPDREWVRCVEWAGRDVLCLATNAGLVHRVALPSGGAAGGVERWRTLLVSPGAGPIVSSCIARHAVAPFMCVGQMDGWAAVLKLDDPALAGSEDDGSAGGVLLPPPPLHRWQPHDGAAVISTFAAHSPLPVPSAFTASHDSVVRWWRLGAAAGDAPPQLLAEASLASCLPGRTLGGRGFSGKAAAMDVDAARCLWLVGDHTGNVLLLRLPAELDVDGAAPPSLASPVAFFRAAHGACAINHVRFSPDGGARTAGRDGFICAFEPVAVPAGGAALALASTEHVSAVNSITDEVAAPGGGRGGGGRLIAGFASNRLIVWSEARGAELLSVDCGGQRRPHALRLRGPCDAAFAYVRGTELAVHRLQPVRTAEHGAGGDTARSFGASWHGREANACLALPAPGGGTLVLSGGEDGAVRALVFGSSGGLPGSSHLGDHPTGAAVRCLHAVPSGPGDWLLVSGGAKAVLGAWELRAEATLFDSIGPSQITHRLLGTRPPRGGVRPKRGGGAAGDAGRAELRILALALLPLACSGSPVCADIVTAASDASLTIVRLHVGARTWVETASLQSIDAPVLALATLPLGARMLLIGGATSGAIGVWDITSSPSLVACSGGETPPQLPLMRTLPTLHQSGVNCLAALPLLSVDVSGGDGHHALLVCGGDDQAMSAMLLEAPSGSGGAESLQVRGARALRWQTPSSLMSLLRPPPPNSLLLLTHFPVRLTQVLASNFVPNAHGSALRGMALLPSNSGPSLAFSTGLDQVLRCWHVRAGAAGVSISEAAACALETLEPAALAASGGDSAGVVHVAVVGRGAQLVSFEGIG